MINQEKETTVFDYKSYVIVCGLKGSGKSTIIRQLMWYNNNKLCDAERPMYARNIRQYLLEIIFTLVDAMLKSTPTMTFDKLENQDKFNYLKNIFYVFEFCNYNDQFHDYIESIWLDKNIQKVLERKNDELQLQENARYFLDRIDHIKQHDYLPTEEDILHCYTPTTRATERNFKLESSPIHITEIVNQDKIFFRKWARCFENVKSIIFVTACDSYNIPSTADSTKTKLQESMDLFSSVLSIAWFSFKKILLFLNKQDLLEEKLLDGRYRFEDYFENFRNYCPSLQSLNLSSSIESEPFEVLKVKHFIGDEFLKRAELHRSQYVEPAYIYTHFSSAVKRKEFNSIIMCTVDVISRCNLCSTAFKLL